MGYIEGLLASLLTTVFFTFLIAALGYLLGAVKIRGVSLGTAGVLLTALAFGMVSNALGPLSLGELRVSVYDPAGSGVIYSFLSNLGTALFVTSVGLMAGPTFFRGLSRRAMGYVLMGLVIVGSGAAAAGLAVGLGAMPGSLAAGLLTGALTSTPGLSAARDVSSDPSAVTAGYGIAYLFGVLGVVLFVQLLPRLLRADPEAERRRLAAEVRGETAGERRLGALRQVDRLGLFPFALTVVLGLILGAVELPVIGFSLGSSGGTLLAGLVVGHFGRLGRLDLRVEAGTLRLLRELGLMMFLIGAGVPGGVNFMRYLRLSYFLWGMLMTVLPMALGFIFGRYVLRMGLYHSLGAITGGMTSTPALGTLVDMAGTEDAACAYAAVYPAALVLVVLTARLMAAV